jgi:hypothetical protein
MSFVNREQCFDALQFDDDRILDQQIKSIARVQMQAVLENRECDLRLSSNACLLEFVHQAGLINALQHTESDSSAL